MKISILTLFPEMFVGPFDHSIVKHARQKKLLAIELVNIRDSGIGGHKVVDDRPFGGGVGMILRVDVIDRAIEKVRRSEQRATSKRQIILLDPKGETFTQKKARELAKLNHLILIAGHYEGVDERVREYLVDESLSIGKYVLTGGEIPAMVIVDALTRLIPGVLKEEATESESFSPPSPFLEYPQYTRPREYRGWQVPEVLLSGDHEAIEKWRKANTLLAKRVLP